MLVVGQVEWGGGGRASSWAPAHSRPRRPPALTPTLPPPPPLLPCPALPPLQDSKHFSIIIEMPDTNPPRYLHTAIAIASIVAAFVLYATEVLDILPGAAIVVAIMLLTGCMSPDQARRSIRWVGVGVPLEEGLVGRMRGACGVLARAMPASCSLLLPQPHFPARFPLLLREDSIRREMQPLLLRTLPLSCCCCPPPNHLHCRTSI